jgi:hypothetical protein
MTMETGPGIHDSSAALAPYLLHARVPFILVSTGTWCITMNPFNRETLTSEELRQDCLCYLSFQGTPVKSSRFFLGHIHDLNVRIMEDHFRVKGNTHRDLTPGPEALRRVWAEPDEPRFFRGWDHTGSRKPEGAGDPYLIGDLKRVLGDFESLEEAYLRFMAEITRLADLSAVEAPGPTGSVRPGRTVALVDGTLILWVLENRSEEWKRDKVMVYLDQLRRMRESGAAVGAFTSRPRRGEVTKLLYLASVDGDANRAGQEANPLEHLPDRAIFSDLPAGARSALFISPSSINHNYYEPAGHGVYFFYLNLAEGGHDPVIARIEVPAWVVAAPKLLALIHGAVVAQARITGDYPYALTRADELAYISGPEREALAEMVATAMLRAGVSSEPSPKAHYKSLTRRGRRKYPQ